MRYRVRYLDCLLLFQRRRIMSAKMAEARKSAFLRFLAETGNQTLAAERAKVSRSWVLLHRKQNPAFDAACREAAATAREHFETLRASGEAGTAPPSGWGFLDGVELVVRGTNGRRVQVARARERQISPRTEMRLLQVLAATCNGKAACAAAEVSVAAVWAHRKRWRGFEAKWQAAVKEGYVRLEAGLIQNGENLFSATEAPPELPMPPLTFEQVIHLLHMHKHQALGLGKAPGAKRRPPPTLEEMRPSILRTFRAFDAARRLSAETRARDEKEWARRRRG